MKIKKPGSNPPSRIASPEVQKPASTEAATAPSAEGLSQASGEGATDEFVIEQGSVDLPAPAAARKKRSEAEKRDAIYARSLSETQQKLDGLTDELAAARTPLFEAGFSADALDATAPDLSKHRRRHGQLRRRQSTLRRRRTFLHAPAQKAALPSTDGQTALAQTALALEQTMHGSGFVARIEPDPGQRSHDFGTELAQRAGLLAQSTAAMLADETPEG